MVIDSDVLLWWLEGNSELPEHAEALLDDAEQGQAAYIVNAVSLWELPMKERRGLLRPTRPVREWPAYLKRLIWLQIESTGVEVWLRSAGLDWTHSDPADRILAATALHYGVPVLTKDRVFHATGSPVEAIW